MFTLKQHNGNVLTKKSIFGGIILLWSAFICNGTPSTSVLHCSWMTLFHSWCKKSSCSALLMLSDHPSSSSSHSIGFQWCSGLEIGLAMAGSSTLLGPVDWTGHGRVFRGGKPREPQDKTFQTIKAQALCIASWATSLTAKLHYCSYAVSPNEICQVKSCQVDLFVPAWTIVFAAVVAYTHTLTLFHNTL